MEEGPFITWRIALSLGGAGLVTFALGVGGWLWFVAAGLPVLEARGLSILIIPGVVLFILLLGVVWFQVFSLLLTLLRADEADH